MRLWLLLRDMKPLPSWKWEKRVRFDFYSRRRIMRGLTGVGFVAHDDAGEVDAALAVKSCKPSAHNRLDSRERPAPFGKEKEPNYSLSAWFK